MTTRITVAGYESPSLLPPNLYDIREDARKLGKKREDVREKVGPTRDWSKVTGICFHQTAVTLGRRTLRWASLGAHIGITQRGKTPLNRSPKVLWCHSFDRIVWHGNGWNNQTVGIEIDGSYEGIEGDDSTLWRPKKKPNLKPTILTEEVIEVSKEVVRWIDWFVESRGGKLKVLVAHRQSSKSRRNDPGSAIYQRIMMPMMEELGLNDGNKEADSKFAIGGYPIPTAWNPAYKGVKY